MKSKKTNRARLAIGLLVAAILIAAAALNRKTVAGRAPDAAYADAKPAGGKGLALMLNQLGYQTAVQSAPLQTMPKNARVWLLLGPKTQFSPREGEQLLAWVKRGNLLIFCANRGRVESPFAAAPEPEKVGPGGVQTVASALEVSEVKTALQGPTGAENLPDLPALSLDAPSNYRAGVKSASATQTEVPIGRAHLRLGGAPGGTLARLPYGRGAVWVTNDAWLFTNYGLSKPNNATLVANLIRADAPQGTVYFDERSSGKIAPDSLISRLKKPPVSYALWQLLGAGLLLWALAGRRLGAAVALPERGPVTRASQFAQAMGAVFSRTGRPSAAAAIIGDNFRRRLAQRLGMSPAERDEVLARRAHEVAGVPAEVVDRLLLQTRAPAKNEAQALRDAQEMDAILKQLEGHA